MKRIVLGVCSSISIYKACEIVRGLQDADCGVQVVMTRNAAQLVSPRLFCALTGKEVFVELFRKEASQPIPHIELARDTDLLLVAPATANVLGKFAAGVADDFLSTLYLAVHSPVLIAPAMNENMYLHPQTQANIFKLKQAGIEFVEPDQGYLACGSEGWGRLASPQLIIQRALKRLEKSQGLKDRKILITAGPTREFLDPVRYISNRSSGKMGYCLAEEAVSRGAETTLISGPSQLFPPRGVTFIPVESAADMRSEVLKVYPESDIVIMAAAVSDFRFSKPSKQKLKKKSAPAHISVETTVDILEELGKAKGKTVLVGFAAETDALEKHAFEKLRQKNLDILVANDVSRSDIGFDADLNEVSIYTQKGLLNQTEKLSKPEISRIILDEIEVFLGRPKRETAS